METEKTQLFVSGMHCTSCAIGVHKMLENKGLKDVKVDYVNDEVLFSNSAQIPIPQIVKDIESLGYQVSLAASDEVQMPWYQNIELLFGICLVFSIPLVSHMFLHIPLLHNPWFQLVMCIPVFIIGTFYFGKSAYNSLKLRLPNMDVLIYTGALAAFSYSLVGTILNLGENFMFYETAATIITLVFLGNIFEKRAVQQTTSAMKDLLQLQKSVAQVISEGNIVQKSAEEVKIGEKVLVKEGDRIPVDGKIIFGDGAVDESMLSGESIPVDKILGAEVFAGSVLVKGTLHIESTKTYQGTALAQIIRLVKNAQENKPNIQKLGDKVAGIFVPVIISVSIITFLLSFLVFDIAFKTALMSAIAVLVISCPCAMGLATPTAVMVGLGRATKMGVLIKGAQTIEELAQVKTIVFDKTGTLTTGKFKIQHWEWFKSDELQNEVKDIVFALEQYSNHPIAKSLVEELQSPERNKIFLKNIQELKGLGLEAEDFKGNTYRIGSNKLFNLHEKYKKMDLFVFKNEELLAGIQIMDALKPRIVETLQQLKAMHIETILLSGDREDKCLRLANEIGISKVYAEKMPEQKLRIIEELKKLNKTAMVGDGINDGPALTTADIGISLSGASDIAVQASKVVLLNAEISNLPQALALARTTYKTIKQNLFWAFAYNIVAVPMAAMGMLSPMLGVFAMACSDVVVIGNSLLLKIKKLALR